MNEQNAAIPHWGAIPPLYRIERSYDDNFSAGPQFTGSIPARPPTPKKEWVHFLGFPLRSRIGVAAGPLLSSSWTTIAARLGFDLVTYKTIRSRRHPAHSFPNVVCVDVGDAVACERLQPITAAEQLSITNSFGMPSQAPEFLLQDIADATRALEEGQQLVVSVVGSGETLADAFADYGRAAQLAVEAGARLLEINASCPNVASGGELYTNPEQLEQLCRAVQRAVPEVPFIIKVGLYHDLHLLRRCLNAAARGGAHAISGINSIPMKAVTCDYRTPLLGEERPQSGICGAAIRHAALEFIRQSRHIIDKDHLPISLIGVGGIAHVDDIDLFLTQGCDLVQTATGMMWDPHLALRHHSRATAAL